MNRREFLQTSLGGAALAAAPIYLDAADAAAGGRGIPTNGQGHQSELLTLRKEAETLGKPEWREMLLYLATLHEKGTHPGQPAFPFEWEEIGIGYHARAFGHWDIVHIVLDVLSSMPIHARHQILNNLANQQADGLVPGSIYLERQWVDGKERYVPDYNRTAGHPALWPFAVQAYYDHTGDTSLIAPCCEALLRQIQWFETHRKAKPAG